MADAKARDLAELRRQIVETPSPLEPAHGLDLGLRRTARADEVGVVGVRQPVRARLRCTDDGSLLKRQGRVAPARGGERSGDRVDTLPIRDAMPATLLHGEVGE